MRPLESLRAHKMRFPDLEAHDLEGRRYVLPGDLPGGRRIVILAFQRWHTILIEAWMPPLQSLAEEFSDVSVWEVPTLSRRYLPGRAFIDGGMRAGIPDPGARQHTLTAYTRIPAVLEALELPDAETIYVLLLDADGDVVWQAAGPIDRAKLDSLTAALRRGE